MTDKDDDLHSRLTPEQYHVTQEKGTERAFTGKYDKHFEDGSYKCVVCGEELFTSSDKFNSGCGWPAFSAPAVDERVEETMDYAFGMKRVEVTCSKCGAHLGHVFDDGPGPTHLRYCINPASLYFDPEAPK